MGKLPTSMNNEVVIFRLSKKLKDKLNQLAKRSHGTSSSVIRSLIESESRRY